MFSRKSLGLPLRLVARHCLERIPGTRRSPQAANCFQSTEASRSGTDWIYVTARRLLPVPERSLARGAPWVVFEPSSEPPRHGRAGS
jgi:hypothetical protein